MLGDGLTSNLGGTLLRAYRLHSKLCEQNFLEIERQDDEGLDRYHHESELPHDHQTHYETHDYGTCSSNCKGDSVAYESSNLDNSNYQLRPFMHEARRISTQL